MDTESRYSLLNAARSSIVHTLETGCAWTPDLSDYPPALQIHRATFVTLLRAGRLRGCIGTTEANDPLILSTARYAHAAAFHDPRFPPVTREEFETICISLSLLTPAEELIFADEAELVEQIRPGHDGLIIAHDSNRAVFLPSVWESLPDPVAFLRELKHKGGLPLDHPPQRAWRYTTETISEKDS